MEMAPYPPAVGERVTVALFNISELEILKYTNHYSQTGKTMNTWNISGMFINNCVNYKTTH